MSRPGRTVNSFPIQETPLGGRNYCVVSPVAVLGRSQGTGRLHPIREYCKFECLIVFPDRLSESDLEHIQRRVNLQSRVKFSFLNYDVKPDRDPVDLAVARIMRRMQDLEVEAVSALSRSNSLGNRAMLVVDGPLRLKEMRGRVFDIVQFRNVVGLSKTFCPTFSLGKGSGLKHVGSITYELEFGERTSVFRAEHDNKSLGVWYLRIRPRRMMGHPLEGIVKMECYALDPEEIENGLDAERVDVVSGHVLKERNVTPFKSDQRWASHIYPIFLAETYVKDSLISDVQFRAMF